MGVRPVTSPLPKARWNTVSPFRNPGRAAFGAAAPAAGLFQSGAERSAAPPPELPPYGLPIE